MIRTRLAGKPAPSPRGESGDIDAALVGGDRQRRAAAQGAAARGDVRISAGSFGRCNATCAQTGGVVYGGGNRGTTRMARIEHRLSVRTAPPLWRTSAGGWGMPFGG